jgi:hypothetical protein
MSCLRFIPGTRPINPMYSPYALFPGLIDLTPTWSCGDAYAPPLTGMEWLKTLYGVNGRPLSIPQALYHTKGVTNTDLIYNK